jgi:hypothetical protein
MESTVLLALEIVKSSAMSFDVLLDIFVLNRLSGLR